MEQSQLCFHHNKNKCFKETLSLPAETLIKKEILVRDDDILTIAYISTLELFFLTKAPFSLSAVRFINLLIRYKALWNNSSPSFYHSYKSQTLFLSHKKPNAYGNHSSLIVILTPAVFFFKETNRSTGKYTNFFCWSKDHLKQQQQKHTQEVMDF